MIRSLNGFNFSSTDYRDKTRVAKGGKLDLYNLLNPQINYDLHIFHIFHFWDFKEFPKQICICMDFLLLS